jgi:hypothetical protein
MIPRRHGAAGFDGETRLLRRSDESLNLSQMDILSKPHRRHLFL